MGSIYWVRLLYVKSLFLNAHLKYRSSVGARNHIHLISKPNEKNHKRIALDICPGVNYRLYSIEPALLGTQIGALRINAYRDFYPIPIPSIPSNPLKGSRLLSLYKSKLLSQSVAVFGSLGQFPETSDQFLAEKEKRENKIENFGLWWHVGNSGSVA